VLGLYLAALAKSEQELKRVYPVVGNLLISDKVSTPLATSLAQHNIVVVCGQVDSRSDERFGRLLGDSKQIGEFTRGNLWGKLNHEPGWTWGRRLAVEKDQALRLDKLADAHVAMRAKVSNAPYYRSLTLPGE
jgi:hypothetical protein